MADRIRKGERPEPPAPPPSPPPRLSIEPPDAGRPRRTGSLTLTIRADGPAPADLRLYRDGIPVREAEDFRPDPAGRSVSVSVRLR